MRNDIRLAAVLAAVLAATVNSASGNDADLQAAERAFGAKQQIAPAPGRNPEHAPFGFGRAAGDRSARRSGAADVQDTIDRTGKIADTALADHNRGDFDARIDASIAGVTAMLDAPSRVEVGPAPTTSAPLKPPDIKVSPITAPPVRDDTPKAGAGPAPIDTFDECADSGSRT